MTAGAGARTSHGSADVDAARSCNATERSFPCPEALGEGKRRSGTSAGLLEPSIRSGEESGAASTSSITSGGSPFIPGGKPADPIGKLADPSGKPADPNGKPADPTGKQTDPIGKLADPSGKPADPNGKPADPTGKQTDPIGKPADPKSGSAGRSGSRHALVRATPESSGTSQQHYGELFPRSGTFRGPGGTLLLASYAFRSVAGVPRSVAGAFPGVAGAFRSASGAFRSVS